MRGIPMPVQRDGKTEEGVNLGGTGMANGETNRSQRSEKTYRVVQWAAGRMGKKAIRAVVDHPDLELVGLHVHSGDKEGKDAGVLAGTSPVGILATRGIEDVVALEPDCVLYMQEGFDL